jgi:hypothetical protein
MDGTGEYHVKQSKPGSETQRPCFLSYVEDRPKRHRYTQIQIWSYYEMYLYTHTYMCICMKDWNEKQILLGGTSGMGEGKWKV